MQNYVVLQIFGDASNRGRWRSSRQMIQGWVPNYGHRDNM